jgi:hypothetical protein
MATRAVVDIERASARIASGRPSFDPVQLIGRSRTIGTSFDRGVEAFELAGLASSTIATTVRRSGLDANRLAVAWAAGEAPPSSPTLLFARRVAGVVASAVLHKNARAVARASSFDGWTRPICPCCGGAPDLSLADEGRRTLVCGRCDTSWSVSGRGCLVCKATSAPTVARVRTAYLGYDLVICHACGRYLKERSGQLRFHPLVERALTTEADVAAQSRGLRL